ncbi:YggS family pyridoxal phosphate-dependent enzyme [Nocardioides mesophilus]|uniref:Pyridoxal phosphate homeostasis protein n=1 Tax=Nocardioides mesophilus TaxID=433659 RepID=A0A7G9RBW0_9ACTN|nr:YggS family pyridoxal phosphate-dependent enzyme [Nocardioides mesophilus]QNN53085.1 YggS family pyridoxal phosphate-dependent enzyme [Nocardioides mesophilus]
MSEDRRAELEGRLGTVRDRIATACAEAGRAPGEVTLTVVTKFFPASDVRLLAALGVTDVGENRHQEAEAKAAECADLGLRWHFVGSLQSNKAAAVAAYADVVESVDRAKLLPGLSRGAHQRGRVLDCLVQVNLDPDEGAGSARGGAAPREVGALAERLAATEGLRLRGVMAVAPPGADPRPAFERLAESAEVVRRVDPAATWVSAGMSGDLEVAVRTGATHVRIGSAVLGPRPPLG